MANDTKNIVRASKPVLDFLMGDKGQVDFAKVIEPEYLDSEDCRRDTWGTSSNAYETELKDGDLHFTTSWVPPTKVIVNLSTMFPDEVIQFAYADEHSEDSYLVCELKAGWPTKFHYFPEGDPGGYNLWCLIYAGQTARAYEKDLEAADRDPDDFPDDFYDVFSRLKAVGECS